MSGSRRARRSRQPECISIALRTRSTPGLEVPGLHHPQPGPEHELLARGRELQGLPAGLRGVVVSALGHQGVGFVRERVGIGEVEKPPELAQGVRVILDAKLDGPPPRLTVGRDHDECG